MKHLLSLILPPHFTPFNYLIPASLILCSSVIFAAGEKEAPTRIDDRRELFVEDSLIDRIEGDGSLRLHHPTSQEISLNHDEEWEGTGSGYHSIFQDGEIYRMYYKAWHLDVSPGKVNTGTHPLFCCYAESKDGIHWTKPKLGIHEFKGSKENNIVMVSGPLGDLKVDAGHPAVFRDNNPAAPDAERYKAVVRSSGKSGLLVFQSPDGLHWKLRSKAPIFSGIGAFDSQNLAFWDPTLGKYRAYWRIFTEGVTTEKEWAPGGYRAIRTATSEDLDNWSKAKDLTYQDSPAEHLYTNQVKPYLRAPHLLLGFPTRYVERKPTSSMTALPDSKEREMRASATERYGYALTEGLVMASRDGVHFKRWNEAFLRPGIERKGTWHYGHQYMAWHAVETRSSTPGAPNELSLYASEDYWHGKGSALRRYTLRLDGFVSFHTNWKGGELVTRPIILKGKSLSVNFATSAAGSLRLEIQNPDGSPVPGFGLDDCVEQFGDSVDRTMTWKKGTDLSAVSGKPVRLRFVGKDADLYSYKANP